MPWWLDIEKRPGRIRSLWIHHTRFIYRGPKAWVVKLNLALSGLTLVPYVQFFIFWLFRAHRILGGDENTLVGGFVFLSLALTSAIPYVVCFIPLLARRLPTPDANNSASGASGDGCGLVTGLRTISLDASRA